MLGEARNGINNGLKPVHPCSLGTSPYLAENESLLVAYRGTSKDQVPLCSYGCFP
jgi:hypothetical protein